MLDPRTHNPTNSFQLYDETRHKTHSYEATNSGLWPSKPAQFRTEPMEMDVDESGICSPPRWSTSPQRYNSHYRSFSPSSRTEAIVRGQRELMEMVRSMPESNYELSLKDLVEHHRVVAREENMEEERNSSVYKGGGGGGGGGGGRKVEKMAQVKKRNGNIDRGGFYLKVVFPFSLGSKDKKNKKKKNESSGNSSSKVSPKPSASNGSVKGVDKEWWKKSPSAYRESDSSSSMKSSGSSSSSNSSSSRRSNSRREKGGVRCWHFIRRPKSQAKK